MRITVQRVKSASVTVNNEIVGKIGHGLLVLVGIGREDTWDAAKIVANDIINLKQWSPNEGSKDYTQSIVDKDYEVLLVSQFTMYGIMKGNKPDFHLAMTPKDALPFYDDFVKYCKEIYKEDKIQCGVFGADMLVDFANDGPVTIIERNP